ncbi:MAG: signal peptidase I [Coriobacteriia bacterium]
MDTEQSHPYPEELSEEPEREAPVSFGRWLGELVMMVALAFLLASGIRAFVIQPYVIPTSSMEPTIEISDRVLANKFVYRFSEPQAGDIVVLDDPTETVQTLIKRVVATGGQTVDIENGGVLIDGVPIDEPYSQGAPTEPMIIDMPYTVPEGSVWLMGDNRPNSADSRVFGAVPLSDINGKAFFTFWPVDRMGSL